MKLLKVFQPKKQGLILSQFSSLPRYFTISKKDYDLDDPESVAKLPMFEKSFTIWGIPYTMPVLLRQHACEVCEKNYDLYIAALNKAREYEEYIEPLNQKEVFHKPNNTITVDEMDGYQFEEWCANLLKRLKFTNIRRTGKSGDQGVDILAEKDDIKYAIQCKCYSSDLGNTPIQEVYAGKNFYNCHVGAVMTNRRFTHGGRQLAKSTGVLIWDRDWLSNAQETIKNQPAKEPKKNKYNDELVPEAAEFVIGCGIASVDILRMGFNLGYARAARIIDELEELGVVGPFRGSKPREVFMSREEWASMF